MTTIEPPPDQSVSRQVGEAVVRAAAAVIPFAGGAVVEAFTFATQRGYQRRFHEWMAEVSDAINRLVLEPHGQDWASLETNEGFLDAIAHATRSATQTSSQEKRAALRAAVVNAALRPDLPADRTAILLDLLDTLTASHLRLLALFADPHRWLVEHSTDASSTGASDNRTVLVEMAYPEIAADPPLMNKLIADLDTHKLVTINLDSFMTESGTFAPKLQPLGTELLELITEPHRARRRVAMPPQGG
ncbi:hypothetical protein [Cellulomonas oligotrophica]|uniref:Uncharacterized protein n=1 Tax=Cellulomonas oligotrophica TaxID=931536 RepID=A0A7Y9FET4_9CELL|nr:hypothetical protein [Cellulomonas oligotrophica]NYD85934.1 hypothetical protein [Cellulomonas oligotrophica]GIG31058.1 hypothetical protein Col01nite_02170 [Cellulomonas oligotrophica]